MLSRRCLLLAAAGLMCAIAADARQTTHVSLDDFVELSKRLLRTGKVDAEIAEIYLAALNADPESAVTLAYIVQSNGNPTPEQAALSATIIEWWRSGVYEVRGERRLAARSRAVWATYPGPQM